MFDGLITPFILLLLLYLVTSKDFIRFRLLLNKYLNLIMPSANYI